MNSKKYALIALLGAASSVASADRIDLVVFENADDADVSGLSLWVDVIDRGTHADFVFHNDSTISSFVRSVYIEGTSFADDALDNGRVGASQQDGVSFVEGGSPPNPAGSIKHFGGNWQGNLFSSKADKGGSGKDGIDEGEQLVLQFDYDQVTFAELMSSLTSDEPGFRIAQHVQGLPDGSSVWTKNDNTPENVVPLPSGAAMSLAGLGLIAGRRRR
ncbi:MAG: VPLPA-CTERM sorting domain-containing protein [Phycisphaerales bacterium JB054]